MNISELRANTGDINIEGEIVMKESTRAFEKFGKSGKVSSAILKDESGEVKLSLWNDDAEKINQGDKVKVTNGWCKEWQGQLQVSTGRNGKIEKI